MIEQNRAQPGNQLARKYTLEDATPIFDDAVEYAKNDDECLCVQDAIAYTNLPFSTFYDLCKQFSVLESKKREMNEHVIRRINKGAVHNKFNASASIWRMKQLGERDKSEVEQTVKTINEKDESLLSELND